MNTLEKEINEIVGFHVNLELEEFTEKGILNFSEKEFNTINSSWSGNELTIPVYGLYKVSWGFYQNALESFYNSTRTELSLIINSNKHKEVAEITRRTPSVYAEKSSHKSLTLILRENERLSLYANVLNRENPKMKDIYFNIQKIEMEESFNFGF